MISKLSCCTCDSFPYSPNLLTDIKGFNIIVPCQAGGKTTKYLQENLFYLCAVCLLMSICNDISMYIL